LQEPLAGQPDSALILTDILACFLTDTDILDVLQREHHVTWSVQVLRQVTAAVSAGIAPYLRAAQQRAVLSWSVQARQSRGRRRVVLAVGRDGIMLPIRDQEHYLEGGVATHGNCTSNLIY
jgi:hypothetical protein